MGFIITLSYDRAMYIYGEDHMTSPKRVAKASAARFSALAWDKNNNWLLTGAADGCVKVWSQEGRILDELMHTSDQVLYMHMSIWWCHVELLFLVLFSFNGGSHVVTSFMDCAWASISAYFSRARHVYSDSVK